MENSTNGRPFTLDLVELCLQKIVDIIWLQDDAQPASHRLDRRCGSIADESSLDAYRLLSACSQSFHLFPHTSLTQQTLEETLMRVCPSSSALLTTASTRLHWQSVLSSNRSERSCFLLSAVLSLYISQTRPTEIGQIASTPNQHLCTRQLSRFSDGVDQQVIQLTQTLKIYWWANWHAKPSTKISMCFVIKNCDLVKSGS